MNDSSATDQSQRDKHYLMLAEPFLNLIPKSDLNHYKFSEIKRGAIKDITCAELKTLEQALAPIKCVYFLIKSNGALWWVGESLNFIKRMRGQHIFQKMNDSGSENWSSVAVLTFPLATTKRDLRYVEQHFIRRFQPQNSQREDTKRCVTRMQWDEAAQLKAAGIESVLLPLSILVWEKILPKNSRVKPPKTKRVKTKLGGWKYALSIPD